MPQRKSSGGGLMSRMNRLVTITPFRPKGSAPKPEEAVSGIPVTPVVVATKHYKIRMDQRIHPAAMAPRSSTSSSRKQQPSTSS